MAVSKQTVLDALPKYVNKRVPIIDDQRVQDIISTMVQAHKEFEPLYDRIGYMFIGENLQDTCDNLYDFCKTNLKYKEEDQDLQTVNAPQVLVTLGHCDCKGYASFICGCLSAIERYTGKKIPWEYCFASYEMFERTPYHVFCIVSSSPKSFWVDPTPGADKKKPMWWFRKKVKSGNMALVKVVGKINSGAGVVRNIGAVMPVEGQSVYQGPIPPTSVQQSDAAEALLLGASFEPSLLSAGPQVTENISEVSPPPMETAAANSAVVPDKSGSNGYLLVGAIIAGVGGVYYMGRQKGIVGKKSKNKKSSLTPFLLVGGAALAYWYFYVHTPDAPAAQVYTDPNTGVQTTVPVNTAPAGAITVSPEVAIPCLFGLCHTGT